MLFDRLRASRCSRRAEPGHPECGDTDAVSMNLTVSASTDGPDDAETLALILESIASQIRAGGGEPVHADGEFDVTAGGQKQQVFLSFVAR